MINYDLNTLYECSTQMDYLDNLYIVHQLELLFKQSNINLKQELNVLDIGCKNWHYVFGLHSFFQHYLADRKRTINLSGVEIDGFVIYSDFYSRSDYAKAYIKQITGNKIQFIVKDYLNFNNGLYDIITFFYPFMNTSNQLHWGLPLKFFQPNEIFMKSYQDLSVKGILVVFTHTQKEYDELIKMLKEIGFKILSRMKIKPIFISYASQTTQRMAIIAVKS